jgi:hypothetical protein
MPTTKSSNPSRQIRRMPRHDVRQRAPRALHVVPVHTPTGRRSHHLSCVHTGITTVNWLENLGGTQDAALNPAVDRVADVFPDESAIAEAGWASQEASDLLGRLLRSMSDKGVVAVLDPRLATARYGGFLRASLPPFWTTYDPAVVRAALKRLDAAQTP